MEFQRIPAGTLFMGSRSYSTEEPVHHVQISRLFYLGTFPVTQEQFGVWTRLAGIKHTNFFPGNPHHPAEHMSWFDAIAFCDWLTVTYITQTSPGFVAGLPTEAQWEYACRAGTETEYHTGDGEAALAAAGWYYGNSGKSSHPVGQKSPNPWGLYDMHGNVFEWCQDVWDRNAYKKRPVGLNDPIVSSSDEELSRQVFRGGSYHTHPFNCRSATRGCRDPNFVNRQSDLGFRVCLSPGPLTDEETVK